MPDISTFSEGEDRDGCSSLIISISKCSISNQWHLNVFRWALNDASSSCSQQVLPSLQPQIRLCSATVRSQRRSGRAPVNRPAHSLRPAGPETGRGSSLQLLDLQTAGREPPGRSTASWLHICGTGGFVIPLFVYMMFTSCRIHMTWMFLWCFTDKKISEREYASLLVCVLNLLLAALCEGNTTEQFYTQHRAPVGIKLLSFPTELHRKVLVTLLLFFYCHCSTVNPSGEVLTRICIWMKLWTDILSATDLRTPS